MVNSTGFNNMKAWVAATKSMRVAKSSGFLECLGCLSYLETWQKQL